MLQEISILNTCYCFEPSIHKGTLTSLYHGFDIDNNVFFDHQISIL